MPISGPKGDGFIDKVKKSSNVELIPGVNITEIFGDKKVQGVLLDNDHKLMVDGIFIPPNTY